MLAGLAMWLRVNGSRCIPSLYLIAAAVLVALHGIIDQILRDEITLAMLGVTFALAIRTAQAEHIATAPAAPRRRRRDIA